MLQQSSRGEIMSTLWHGIDPYANFPRKLFAVDASGWNSDHEFLVKTITQCRPSIAVEIGVWKGGSTLTMANALRHHGVNGVIIAVDTWLGSWDHWQDPAMHAELCFYQGYPNMYQKFLGNVLAAELEQFIVPLPLDSSNAAQVIGNYRLLPSVVHVDGAHDFDSVLQDLQRWWSLLAKGGYMICDDYDRTKIVWPEVQRAVEAFLARTPHVNFECKPYKCRFQKPV